MTKEPEFTLESPAADTSLAVREPSPITILEKAISGGVTQETQPKGENELNSTSGAHGGTVDY
jgi:hypothetical protein